MLLTFLYHHIGFGKYSNSINLLEENLAYLSKKYNIVLPKDKIDFFKLNICLTFDDAFFDFYHFVFPILKKLKIKALLAVPVKFILDDTNIDQNIRLSVSYKEAFEKEIYLKKAPFCTWNELKEMSDSKLVQIASHSYNHQNLIDKNIDLDLEIIQSKKILEEKLQTKINTFVYPFGKFNKEIHNKVKKNYKFIMRIGSSFNLTWQNMNHMTYRIISDNLQMKDENLKFFKFANYLWNFLSNTIRKR